MKKLENVSWKSLWDVMRMKEIKLPEVLTRWKQKKRRDWGNLREFKSQIQLAWKHKHEMNSDLSSGWRENRKVRAARTSARQDWQRASSKWRVNEVAGNRQRRTSFEHLKSDVGQAPFIRKSERSPLTSDNELRVWLLSHFILVEKVIWCSLFWIECSFPLVSKISQVFN